MSLPPVEPPRNRLTIAHLMLWTLGSAVSLAFSRAFSLESQRPDDRLVVVTQVIALINCLPAGAAIGGVLLFAWKTSTGDRTFLHQPGHWLLVIEGFSVLLSWFGRVATVLCAPANHAQSLFLATVFQVPNYVVTAIAFFRALRCLPGESRLWRVALWLLFFEHALTGLTFGAVAICALDSSLTGFPGGWSVYQLFDLQFSCWPSILVLALPIAGLTDPRRNSRDFLHWAGLIAVFATALLNIGARSIIRFFI